MFHVKFGKIGTAIFEFFKHAVPTAVATGTVHIVVGGVPVDAHLSPSAVQWLSNTWNMLQLLIPVVSGLGGVLINLHRVQNADIIKAAPEVAGISAVKPTTPTATPKKK
jgi:hypothetical protein